MLGVGLGLTQPRGRGAGFSPNDIPNIIGWWDASDTATITESGGAVSQLDDKSPNALHMTQATAAAQPTTGTRTLNGLNVLDFDGTDSLVAASTALRTTSSLFVVALGDAVRGMGALSVTEGSSGNRRSLLLDTRTSPTRLFFQIAYLTSTFLDLTSAAPLSVDVPYLMSAVVGSTGAAEAFLNGVSQSTNNVPALTTGDTIKIGTQDSTDLDGIFAEAVVFDRALTAAERVQVETYLMQKWAV